jgi:hypothetical protein
MCNFFVTPLYIVRVKALVRKGMVLRESGGIDQKGVAMEVIGYGWFIRVTKVGNFSFFSKTAA